MKFSPLFGVLSGFLVLTTLSAFADPKQAEQQLIKNGGTPIVYLSDGSLKVPPKPIIPLLSGDGIGVEISAAMKYVVDEAIRLSMPGHQIQWLELPAGESAISPSNSSPLPKITMDFLRKYPVGIKGPTGTPVGKGHRSVNVTLRQNLDLFSCVRPVTYFDPNIPSPLKEPEKVDMVIYRENTEDVYSGIEFRQKSWSARVLIKTINFLLWAEKRGHLRIKNFDTALGIKPVSELASARIAREAFRYALKMGLKNVTVVHKGNIMKETEGLFMRTAYTVALEPEFKDRFINEEDYYALPDDQRPVLGQEKTMLSNRIADNMLQQTKLKPEYYKVLLTLNLNGDYLSDDLASLVGGLGIAPGGNIGDRGAIFEATHGTAPDIAGQNKANPSSLILSATMMLEYMGWNEPKALIENALRSLFSQKKVTGDFYKIPGATLLGTNEFAQALVEEIRKAKGENQNY